MECRRAMGAALDLDLRDFPAMACPFAGGVGTMAFLVPRPMKLIDSIVSQAASIAALRRDIHAHPELCFQEVRTADLVAAKLAEWGIEVHRGLGTTGVVGLVHGRDGGACGRAIGLRADMDALPMQEHNTFAHASRHAGKTVSYTHLTLPTNREV